MEASSSVTIYADFHPLHKQQYGYAAKNGMVDAVNL
jgi:hypothetical protein